MSTCEQVLSPHVYGHGSQSYTTDYDYPNNMPPIWYAHWGFLPESTGVALIVGEWGGVWDDTAYHNRVIKSTAAWQFVLTDYLRDKGMGYFYWCGPFE